MARRTHFRGGGMRSLRGVPVVRRGGIAYAVLCTVSAFIPTGVLDHLASAVRAAAPPDAHRTVRVAPAVLVPPSAAAGRCARSGRGRSRTSDAELRHLPVAYAVIEWLVRRLGCNPSGSSRVRSVHWSFVKVTLAALPLSVAAGALSWYLVERPMIRLAPCSAATTVTHARASRGFHIARVHLARGLLYRIWFECGASRLTLNGDAATTTGSRTTSRTVCGSSIRPVHWFGRITRAPGTLPSISSTRRGLAFHRPEPADASHAHASRGGAIFVIGLIGATVG